MNGWRSELWYQYHGYHFHKMRRGRRKLNQFSRRKKRFGDLRKVEKRNKVGVLITR